MNCSYCACAFSRNFNLSEIFLPKKIVCSGFCRSCEDRFTRLDTKTCCLGCQRQQVAGYCGECLRWQALYPSYHFQHEALYAYDSAMQEWFEAYKFKGNYLLRENFAFVLSSYFKQKKIEVVVPIPLSSHRFSERGFNQVTALLEAAGVPYTSCLLRLDQEESQVRKNRQERLQLKQPFTLNPKAATTLSNKTILIVDDVYTTGRTLFHAAAVLNQENPAKLNTFSLAR